MSDNSNDNTTQFTTEENVAPFTTNEGNPQPAPQPAPQPTPQPAPQPTPQPAPQPTPQPAPQPAPRPTYQQPVYQQPVNFQNNGLDYTPISMWGYFGYELLFSIPCIGFIMLLVFSFGGTKNVNVRNFARSYFCFLIVAVILVIIMFLFLGGLLGAASFSYGY